MPYEDIAKHRMLDHLVGNVETGSPITQVALHTDGSPTSGNEVSGGSYAPQALTFTAAGVEAAGRVDHESVTFDVPGGTTVAGVSYQASDGTIMATASVTSETFNQDGQYQITDASYLDLNG